MMFRGIDAAALYSVWYEVAPHIERICDKNNGRYDTADVCGWLKKRKMQLWVRGDPIDGICLTEILNYPKCKACRIVGASGIKTYEWRKHREILEAWAKENGCTKMEAFARRGWARILNGYDISHCFFEREI